METVQQYAVKLAKIGKVSDSQPVQTPDDVQACLAPIVQDADREVFVVLALDARHRPIGTNVVSIGSLSAAIVHPREVFKFAILAQAESIILAHNHPSGDSTPSRDDIELTKRLRSAGEIMGIEVLDHLIFGDEVLSFLQRGIF